jgi:hypothetical protein
VQNVTSVFALERGNTANRVNANPFVILNPTLIDALFTFGTANAGKTFLVFVQGPGGISRNLTLPLTGFNPTQAGCPAGFTGGNEQGVQVTFTCNSSTTPATGAAVITSAHVQREANGSFSLIVTGSGFQPNATVTVGGKSPKKIKPKGLETGSTTFSQLILRKGFCGGLPGALVVTNPNSPASNAFQVTDTCQ